MQLVEDDGVEIGKQMPAVGMAQEQRQLLGRRHQDVGGRAALALAPRNRGVAGARLGADRSPISAIGVMRLRWTSTASAFKGEM